MRRLSRAALAAATVLAVAAPAASAAAPAPAPVSPADGKQFPPPTPRPITFQVDAQPDEPAGSLHIEFTDADGSVSEVGRYQSDNGVDDYVLEQVEPGGTRYRVKVPASAFERYAEKRFFWHAYRVLPDGSCTPVAGSSGQDCSQESDTREFEMLEPVGYGAYEPNDSPAKATPSKDFFNTDCAYLEKRTDVDWYRYGGSSRALKLRLRLDNYADSDRWVPLRSRRRESADMSVALYRASGVRKIASVHVPVGKTRVLKAKLKRGRAYLFAVRHAGNGFPKAKPAKDMSYGFKVNFPGAFSDANGCV
jgi:hypothetical protein